MAVALLAAAGRGERLGSDGPKALVPLAGRPMLEWSIRALAASPAIEQIVVALPAGVRTPAGCVGVVGGRERAQSVFRALAAARPSDVVLIHDAARPLLTPALVAAIIGALDETVDGAIAATPASDTIKRAGGDGIVTDTPPRDGLWTVQTPQVFRREALERAFAVAPELLAAATDEASLVERSGGRVRLVHTPGTPNFKVTESADLRLAEALLRG
ncbi:MAG: 2-C-methyl-D-erythritol 4-phosphate cytidylyltransferase [Solirubrobacteraceae bacterium]